MSEILRLCDSCKFYVRGADSCRAFPKGIPLSSEETHFEVLPDQVGDTVYDLDPRYLDYLDMYRRIHPEVRVPLILTYEIPDEDIDPTDIAYEEEETDDEEPR